MVASLRKSDSIAEQALGAFLVMSIFMRLYISGTLVLSMSECMTENDS